MVRISPFAHRELTHIVRASVFSTAAVYGFLRLDPKSRAVQEQRREKEINRSSRGDAEVLRKKSYCSV
jgi:hypothetical protein